MIQISFVLLMIIFGTNNLFAQRCKAEENTNPLTNSQCRVITTIGEAKYGSDGFKFMVDKQQPNKVYLAIDVINPDQLSSSIGDSAWIVLKDGYVVKLSNEKNFKPVVQWLKALLIAVEYYHVGFIAEIRREDVKQMALSKVKRYLFDIHPRFIRPYKYTNKRHKHPLIPKANTFTRVDDRVEIRINKLYRYQQKNILRTAACASSYIP